MDRPDICRVDKQYNLNYKDLFKWDDFVKLNLDVCNQLAEVESAIKKL